MVIRLCKTVAEFYTDTSTMRPTGETLRYPDKDSTKSKTCRDVNS